jgi:hypothetical protein
MASYLHSQTVASVISGHVYDADTKAALPGVRISSVSPPPKGGAPSVSVTTSNDDGSYTLRLSSGKHVLCADAGRIYLDPCQWSGGSTVVDSTTGTLDFALTRGVLFIIRVSDPNGVTDAMRSTTSVLAKTAGPPLSAVVTDKSGTPHLMPFVQSTKGNTEFALAVPPSQPFTIAVTSTLLNLADASQKALASNAFQVSTTSQAMDTTYVSPSFMHHPVGPNVPSQVYRIMVAGLR